MGFSFVSFMEIIYYFGKLIFNFIKNIISPAGKKTDVEVLSKNEEAFTHY